jgi:hypothetical protein
LWDWRRAWSALVALPATEAGWVAPRVSPFLIDELAAAADAGGLVGV